MVTTACVNSKLHSTEDHRALLSSDKNNYHHTHEGTSDRHRLQRKHGEALSTAGSRKLEDYRGKGCGTAIDTGKTIEHPEPVGDLGDHRPSRLYVHPACPVSSSARRSNTRTARSRTGGPKPRLDPAKLAPPGPI